MDYGAISAVVLLLMVTAFTIWLLWSAFRSSHWAFAWRFVAGALGLIGCLFLAMVFMLFRHGYEDARAMRSFACRSNLNSIGRALQIYAVDNSDLAPLSNWTDSIATYLPVENFTCPATDKPFAFTMNRDFIGTPFPDAHRPEIAAVFDGKGGKNSIGEITAAVFRHDGGIANFLLAEGVVEPRTKNSP